MTFLKEIPHYHTLQGLGCAIITPRSIKANWWWVVGYLSQLVAEWLLLRERETYINSSLTEGLFFFSLALLLHAGT